MSRPSSYPGLRTASCAGRSHADTHTSSGARTRQFILTCARALRGRGGTCRRRRYCRAVVSFALRSSVIAASTRAGFRNDDGTGAAALLLLLLLDTAQEALCVGHAAAWHSFLQYQTALQRLHLRAAPAVPHLAQARSMRTASTELLPGADDPGVAADAGVASEVETLCDIAGACSKHSRMHFPWLSWPCH